MINKYTDRYGLIHPTLYGSENGVLFTAYYHLLKKKQGKLNTRLAKLAIMNTKQFYPRLQANPPQNGDHFSHDNLKGLYALQHIADMGYKGLPIVRWNSRWWIHPNTWMPCLAFKSIVFKVLFFPFIYLMAYVSCKKKKELTSGKLLWWLIFESLYSVRLLPKQVDWAFTFNYYFSNAYRYNNEDHPIRVMSKEIYNEKK